MSLPIRPRIDGLEPYPHGGINYLELERLGIQPESIIDFSVNSNPFGPLPSVTQALAGVSIDRYPDSEATELRRALAVKLGVDTANILVGSGSVELLRLLALSYLGREELVIIPQPTFGEYEVACRLVSARLLKPWAEREANFRMKTSDLVKLIRTHLPKAIFLGNPNNPTGQYLSREEVTDIVKAASESLVVIDEAYINFVNDAWSSLGLIKKGNVVLLRSMTKDYALSGLRLGYAVADKPIISDLRRVQPPWSVNAVAQKAGLLAVKEDGYLEECRAKLQEARNFLVTELISLGLFPLPSQTNFFLVEVGDAKQFRQTLLERRILVRDCASFGLPKYIRLAVRTLPQCQQLIAAIKESGVLNRCRQKR